MRVGNKSSTGVYLIGPMTKVDYMGPAYLSYYIRKQTAVPNCVSKFFLWVIELGVIEEIWTCNHKIRTIRRGNRMQDAFCNKIISSHPFRHKAPKFFTLFLKRMVSFALIPMEYSYLSFGSFKNRASNFRIVRFLSSNICDISQRRIFGGFWRVSQSFTLK